MTLRKTPWKERPRRSLTGANPRIVDEFIRNAVEQLQRSAVQPNPDGTVDVPVLARESFRSFPKTPPLRSRSYLRFVASEPCCSCSTSAPSDPHHFGPRGVGQKTDDFRVVPLCRACHADFHAHGFVSQYGNRATTEILFYRTQVDLLVRWLRETADWQQGKK